MKDNDAERKRKIDNGWRRIQNAVTSIQLSSLKGVTITSVSCCTSDRLAITVEFPDGSSRTLVVEPVRQNNDSVELEYSF